jgi:hypothetical protein
LYGNQSSNEINNQIQTLNDITINKW